MPWTVQMTCDTNKSNSGTIVCAFIDNVWYTAAAPFVVVQAWASHTDVATVAAACQQALATATALIKSQCQSAAVWKASLEKALNG